MLGPGPCPRNPYQVRRAAAGRGGVYTRCKLRDQSVAHPRGGAAARTASAFRHRVRNHPTASLDLSPMTRSIHTMRKSLLSRGMKYLIVLIAVLGAIMLYLLSSASSNTPLFARDLPLILLGGVALVLALMVLVGYQLLVLRRRL